jgi:hypothetical protein
LAAVAVAEVTAEEVVAATLTTSLPFPIGVDSPSKVTSAFSVAHERLLLLNLTMMVLAERGMEKFDCASEMSREIESPTVTFMEEKPDRIVVTQPVAFPEVHVDPVNPFVQMHAHDPLSMRLTPPFLQAVAVSASHCWMADNVFAVVVFDL